MTGPKLLLVTQWFDPEPVVQPRWIAEGLAREGLDVEILTGVPNYPSGTVVAGYSPVRARTEERYGFVIRRTPLYPSHNESSAGRLLNYVSWALSSTVFGRRQFESANVALVYSSPATAALAPMIAWALFRVPYVLIIQDLWPDSVTESGLLPAWMNNPTRRVLGAFSNWAYRNAAHVVVISPGMAQLLRRRGVPMDKITLVYNWIEDLDGRDAPTGRNVRDWRHELGVSPEAFVVMYAGNHGTAQALGSVVDAFAQLGGGEVHLVLVGDGVAKAELVARADAEGLTTVHFVDQQPREAMAGLMDAADVQLVTLADRPLFAVTMPSKLQSILAAGKPVIVMARGDAAMVVETSGAGWAVEPENPTELANAVRRASTATRVDLRAMGERGRLYYQRHMSEKVGASALARVLRDAALPGCRRSPRSKGRRNGRDDA